MNIRQTLSRLSRGLALVLAEAILTRVNDAPRIQEAQVSLFDGETRSALQRLQEYGLSSVPLEGARAVVVFFGGNRDHGVVVATDDGRHRPKGMAAGEMAIYDDLGQVVHLTRAGIVVQSSLKVDVTSPEVTVTAATKVTLDTPLVEVTGEIRAVGEITALAGEPGERGLGGFRDTYNTHTHPENDGGGPTDQPNQQA